MPYPMGAASLPAPSTSPDVSVVRRVLRGLEELAWFVVFVLAAPLAVLAVGIPIALLVNLVIAIAHALTR